MRGLFGGATTALVLAAVAVVAAAQNPPGAVKPEPEPGASQAPKTESAPPEGVKSLPTAVDPNRFVLGAEDVIAVTVWREQNLTGLYVIRADGKFTMPLVGEVAATGMTPAKLSAHIAELLSKYLTNPQVFVDVRAVRSKRYYITGEVNRPGAYPLAVPTRVFEALTLAGGFREFANTKKIKIMRGTQRLKFNYNDIVKGKNLEQNILLENGDTIIVP